MLKEQSKGQIYQLVVRKMVFVTAPTAGCKISSIDITSTFL